MCVPLHTTKTIRLVAGLKSFHEIRLNLTGLIWFRLLLLWKQQVELCVGGGGKKGKEKLSCYSLLTYLV